MKQQESELQMPDEVTPEEQAIIEEAKRIEFPFQAQDPSTGEIKRFRSREELSAWRDEQKAA